MCLPSLCSQTEFPLLLPGPIPPELGKLAALDGLSLRQNQLSGESLKHLVFRMDAVYV